MKKFYFIDWLKSLVNYPYGKDINFNWDRALNEALDNGIQINMHEPDTDNEFSTCFIGNYEIWIFGYKWFILPDSFGAIYKPNTNWKQETMIRPITQYKLQRRIKAEIKEYLKSNPTKIQHGTLNHYRENLVGKERAKFLEIDG